MVERSQKSGSLFLFAWQWQIEIPNRIFEIARPFGYQLHIKLFHLCQIEFLGIYIGAFQMLVTHPDAL